MTTLRRWNLKSGSQLVTGKQMSREVFEKWGQEQNRSNIAEFLSEQGVKNLFFIHGVLSQFKRTFLVEELTVGEKWGTEDIVVDLSDMPSSQGEKWLQAAANFNGAVYMVDLKQIDHILWKTLCTSHVTPPRALFFMYKCPFYLLIYMLKKNASIQNLTLFAVTIDDGFSLDGISLTNLHLINVRMDIGQIKRLCNLNSPPVTHCLEINLSRQPWVDEVKLENTVMWEFHSINRILEWPLTELSLIGMIPSSDALIDFIRGCKNSHLESVILECPNYQCYSKTRLIHAVVDALNYSGLPFIQIVGIQDAAIEAQLFANQQRHGLRRSSCKKESAQAVRLFLCGDAYAGKTTLLSTLSSVCSEERSLDQNKMLKKKESSLVQKIVLKEKASALVHRVKSVLKQQHASSPSCSQRTRGIEVHVIKKDGIRLSVWDMAGQVQFHAFHDHMIPDPSTNLGGSAMFLFVWSPIDSENEEGGSYKKEDDFEASFCYWLKFIASKTRQSNVLRKIIVVLTRKDQTSHMQDALAHSIKALARRFYETIQVVKIMEVDARDNASVMPLASCIFMTAKDVLNGVEVYSVCKEMSEIFSRRRAEDPDPIISWDAFGKLCMDLSVSDVEVQKAIAYSLNESGDLIYLSNLPFLVVDPNWFCHEVMGHLIYFPNFDTCSVYIPKDGYFTQMYLEKILVASTHRKVKGSHLVDLMEAMNLCCKVPDDTDGMVFIPATLGEVSTSERQLQWRGGTAASVQEYAYVGRRLECDQKDLTFLTPGLFPMIQVIFRKAFLESNADVRNGKGFMSICVEDIEIIVELGLANGQHVIDVMVRAPDRGDVRNTVAYVEEEIIKTLIRVCAQREGNQGVKLVVGVIRPDCLWVPAPSHAREDQCVLILDLKQELRKKLEKGQRQERLLHLWRGNRFVAPVTNHMMDLLGFDEYMEVLMAYKASLQKACLLSCQSSEASVEDGEGASSNHTGQRVSESGNASTSSLHAGSSVNHLTSDDSQCDGVTSATNLHDSLSNEGDPILVALSKGMVRVINREMQSMKSRLDSLQCSVDSMREEMNRKLDATHRSIMELRNDVLPKIQRLVEQSLAFAIGIEVGRVPRLGILTTEHNMGAKRRIVTALFKDVKSVRIELFCEHREGAHPVEGQTGLHVTVVAEGSPLQKALPYVNGFLKVLTLAAQVGAHVVAGLPGSTVPDLSKIIVLVFDTPGFLDNQGLFANVSTCRVVPGAAAFTGWQQWLVSVLEKNGGVTESNIASRFRLRRALYEDTSQVAWLCDAHYPQQQALPLV